VATPSLGRVSTRGLWQRLAVGVLLLLALGALLVSPAAAASLFPDVPSSHPYASAIVDLSDRKIISGYEDGTFKPEAPVWRQHFAKMIVLTFGLPVSESDVCPFTDVDTSSGGYLYPDHYIAVCAAKEITKGTSPSHFSPTDNISRAQLVTMVVRAATNLKPGVLSSPPSGYVGTLGNFDPTHGPTMESAEFSGLLAGLQGFGPGWNPWADATRGEVAQILHNLLGKLRPTGFEINGQPYRFLAALIPGWYWGQWSEANDVAIVTQARQAGFTVLQLTLPGYEAPLGTFHEDELKHLDHLVDVARQNGMYLILPFIHGLAISVQTELPFYNPDGLAGLMHEAQLREAFKQHMAKLITRVNSVNGLRYVEDPTILSWMIIEEPVSAPSNYPRGLPDMTASEIADWVQESGVFIKGLDHQHLVSIMTTAAIDAFNQSGQDWKSIFQVSALDFIEAEDAEARILTLPGNMATYDALYAVNKPIVMMLSYTGAVDQNKYGQDYRWQAETMRQVADLYLKRGAVALAIFSWRANTYDAPGFDRNYSYSIDNALIVAALGDIAAKLGWSGAPPYPLDFVGLTH
jgi:hypothetical protein